MDAAALKAKVVKDFNAFLDAAELGHIHDYNNIKHCILFLKAEKHLERCNAIVDYLTRT